ncbi:hotdog family protein [Confluentibacter flavum]|uniref:3-hydroxyacyl-ACP dehydratase n=1 Tax=Confluentibacter flavum TaxID=1909700 RepID=A0A2N3HKK9_9FLAO|nr:3-hydroxyacyl-ACP dehydratase [Confluentibacter flavum]PKQ45486.1 3-hydroxyacyl-ACP dehydratase [Confluentibacter flavum]
MLLDDFYNIIYLKSVKDQSIEASVKINKTHQIFEGHFPKNPVTPGVVMLQILKNCLEIHLEESLFMQQLSRVKFLTLVDPNFDDILNFNIDISLENEGFKIKNHTSFIDGRSILKCNATFVKYSIH